MTFPLASHTLARNAPARPANCCNWEKILSNSQKIPSKMSHCRHRWKTSKTWFYSRLSGRVNQNGKLKPLWPSCASPGTDALTSTIAPGHIWIVGIGHIWRFASGGGLDCDRGWLNGLTLLPEATTIVEILWHAWNIWTLLPPHPSCIQEWWH